ncbi:MAG TPA: outer membrane beta-barrel protein [bacterium]|nr:outer membrane beta-barrel protein [bacterium]
MKRYLFLICFAATAVPAAAVEQGRWGAAVQGIYSAPAGALTQWFKPAANYAITAGQQYNRCWFLEGLLEYSSFSRENLTGYPEGRLELSLEHTALLFSGRYRLAPVSMLHPYLHFGAGVLHWKGVRGEVEADPAIDLPHIDEKVLQEYNWSFRLGAGMEFMISSSLSLDLFAHYRLVIGDLYPTMQPHIELEGVSGFQSLNAGLGLRYYF